MDLEFVVDMYISVVLVACIVAGYVIKKWVKDVNNKWIPTLCCILGMLLACVSINEITLETIVA